MKRLLHHMIRREFGFSDAEVDNIYSLVVQKFLIRVNDDRLPTEYDDQHLIRLLQQFVKFTAIDYIRGEHGRHTRRVAPLSLDEENANGIDLIDRLEQPEIIDIETTEKKRTTKEFFIELLPYLTEREREIIVLSIEIELEAWQIAERLRTSYNLIDHITYIFVKQEKF